MAPSDEPIRPMELRVDTDSLRERIERAQAHAMLHPVIVHHEKISDLRWNDARWVPLRPRRIIDPDPLDAWRRQHFGQWTAEIQSLAEAEARRLSDLRSLTERLRLADDTRRCLDIRIAALEQDKAVLLEAGEALIVQVDSARELACHLEQELAGLRRPPPTAEEVRRQIGAENLARRDVPVFDHRLGGGLML